MKPFLIKSLVLLLIACFVLPLVGCDQPDQPGNGNDLPDGSVSVDEKIMTVNAYEVKPLSSLEMLGNGITDDEYNYFYFKLGSVNNVPVYYENAYLHNGLTESTYTWSQTSIDSEEYENALRNTIKKSTKAKEELSLQSSASVKASASYGGVSAGMEASVQECFKTTMENINEISTEEKFTNTVNRIVQKSQERTVVIPQGSQQGFYRYVVYGNVDIYATLICNIANETMEYAYISVPKESSFFDVFQYSETNDFEDMNPAEKLSLTADMINSLRIDFFKGNVSDKTNDYIYDEFHYSNSKDREISGNGSYGLANCSTRDVLDLSDLSQYMNSDYVFTFDMDIQVENDKHFWGGYINGTHELHLLNQDNANEDILLNDETAKDRGWLHSEYWGTQHGTDTFVWEISGKDCRDIMYIQYDAHGEGEDNWFVKNVQLTITVKKAS